MLSFTPQRLSVTLLFLAIVIPWKSLQASDEGPVSAESPKRPNIILVMADDQGWGDVGYRNHPELKTPVLDDMAANNLLFERFYAAAPVCSPTRGSVLTGRHPNRFACFSWGHPLRPEEITVGETLQQAGYTTGHFGKWHLGSLHEDSPVCPGNSGFDEWFSSPNFFENSPLMSHNGKVIQTQGEGSKVIVDASIEFIRSANARKQPFLAVVWFGSPHGPHIAMKEDRERYAHLPKKLQNFYGEITAMDRAIGQLRQELRRLQIADNTLLWYTSDNGALPVGSTGGLSGRKSSLLEGGIRVPAIIEWPNRIKSARKCFVPCSTVDIYPTLVSVTGASVGPSPAPLDGIDLMPLIEGHMAHRDKPLGFWVYPARGISTRSTQLLQAIAAEQSESLTDVTVTPGSKKKSASDPNQVSNMLSEESLPGRAAWLDGDWKLHRQVTKSGQVKVSLFHLSEDSKEKEDVADAHSERTDRMKSQLESWQKSVVRSVNGEDY